MANLRIESLDDLLNPKERRERILKSYTLRIGLVGGLVELATPGAAHDLKSLLEGFHRSDGDTFARTCRARKQ
jgi:hypothetical protein